MQRVSSARSAGAIVQRQSEPGARATGQGNPALALGARISAPPNRPRPSALSGLARGVAVAATLLGVGVWSGCAGSLAGHWRAVEIVPNKEVFCIDDATFRRDGTFSATTTLEGKTTREAGTYRFNGFKLTLQPNAGGRRTYNALLKFNRLEVFDGKRKVVLKKGK